MEQMTVENDGVYESQIASLREWIDVIDNELIQTLISLQQLTHQAALGEALIYSLLSDDAFSCNRDILTTILRNIRNIPEYGLEITHRSNLEGDEMIYLIGRINLLLTHRFEKVKTVGKLKKKFHKPAMDTARWYGVLENRTQKWKELGGINGDELVPKIWNIIHALALDLEEDELKNPREIQKNVSSLLG